MDDLFRSPEDNKDIILEVGFEKEEWEKVVVNQTGDILFLPVEERRLKNSVLYTGGDW